MAVDATRLPVPNDRLRGWRLPLLALLTGGLVATGQAPLGWAWLAFPALACALALARLAATPRHAALIGWALGSGYFAAGLNWIVEPFLIEPELYGWLIPFALIGLSAGLALFWALAFFVARRLGGQSWRYAIALAIAELARGYLLTGFPWALVGYIWTDTPLAQIAALTGPYGLTALTLLIAALPAHYLAQQGRGPGPLLLASVTTAGLGLALLAVAAMLATHGPNAASDAGHRPILRLVQPNAPQDQKWDPEMIPVFFNRMVDFSVNAPEPDVILWPESALPVLLEEADPTLTYISEATGNVPMVVGVQRSESGAYYNSAAYIDASGTATQVYDKFHLVPFGEYMPFPRLWRSLGISALAARVDVGYSPGPGPRLIDLGFGTALPLICYEAVFPQYSRTTPRPALLLQLTNDAWFGAWTGPYQHLAQARMRAIETGLPMVRVANTGISAVIDARGRVTASLPLNSSGYLDAALPVALPPTPYARTGDVPVALVLLMLGFAAFALQVRNND